MTPARRPLVALLLAPNDFMWEAALSGAKRITIREGVRDYQVGDDLMVCCHVRNSAFKAKITEVRHCRLWGVTPAEYQADGFDSLESLISGLQAFYRDLTRESMVTIIRWSEMEGTAVEKFKRCSK